MLAENYPFEVVQKHSVRCRSTPLPVDYNSHLLTKKNVNVFVETNQYKHVQSLECPFIWAIRSGTL